MIRAGSKMDFAIVLGVLVTIGFFLIIPAVCPGFPKPVVTDIGYSYTSSSGGAENFYLTGTVSNQGTSGNVVVTAKLVNASSQAVRVRSADTIYMQPGERRAISMTVTGVAKEPYEIVVEAQKK
jgi:hypothetical protein